MGSILFILSSKRKKSGPYPMIQGISKSLKNTALMGGASFSMDLFTV